MECGRSMKTNYFKTISLKQRLLLCMHLKRGHYLVLFTTLLLTLSFIYANISPLSSYDTFTVPSVIPPPNSNHPAAVDWVFHHIIFFVHVPKTAGLAFSDLLTYLTQPYTSIYRPHADPQTLASRLDLTFTATKDMIALARPSKRSELTAFFNDTFALQGHSDVLVAEAFDGTRSNVLTRRVEFITMVRHPVQRVLSHYCYMLLLPSGKPPPSTRLWIERHANVYPSWIHYVLSTDDAMSTTSFLNYVDMAQKDGYDNWHTRAFSGCLHTSIRLLGDEPKWCNDDKKMLDEALHKMQQFLFVGVAERYRESASLLAHTLNYNPSKYHYEKLNNPRINKNNGKEDCLAKIYEGTTKEYLEDTISKIEHLDVLLYEQASILFEQRLKMAGVTGETSIVEHINS